MLKREVRQYRQPFWILLHILLVMSSCTTLRNYPPNRPFVYKTNIELEGKFNKDEEKQLVADLEQQLDDSVRVRSKDVLIGWKKGPRFFYTEIVNPPVYDSTNADQSVQFMRALLNSRGYFRDSISYDTSLETKNDQQRTTVNFRVRPGRLITLDSVAFNFNNDTLQAITQRNLQASLLKPGAPFSKTLISAEFDRLVNVYRNNGYLRFSFEDLIAVFDTVGASLLRPTLDPLEQARQLQELQRRRQNPTALLEVRLRPNEDSTHLVRYYVGDVKIYPDLSIDSGQYQPQQVESRGTTIVTYRNRFKPHIVSENNYLHRGQLYSRQTYLRTLNRYNSIGAWRVVNIDPVPRPGFDTVDFVIRMIPAQKYQASVNLEGSQNRGNPLVGQYGLGVTAGLNNRNVGRTANQASTNLRYGIELGKRNVIQTQIITLGHVVVFPRLVPRFAFVPEHLREYFRSSLNFNLNYTDRFNFFKLYAFNFSWGYEYTRNNKQLSIRMPNIEYTIISKRDSLLKLEQRNRSFRYIFNDGLVLSTIVNYTVTGGNRIVSNQKRIGLELSGLIAGSLKNKCLDSSNLYRFVRVDGEFRQTHKLGKSALAWRVYGGLGYSLPRFEKDSSNFYLPFFKQFVAGGPNSMRAWPLRRLGPGSNNKSTADTVAPERFGDVQLEANAEYRFPLANIGGVQLNGAVFTDIGNIWFMRKNADFENGEFRVQRLWRDLAIGAGTGLRIDFGFFLVRFDYAYRAKDPARPPGQTWFYNWKPFNGQLQFGINYPF